MKQEQVQLKMTLLLIKDWDGFQLAMRAIMLNYGNREQSAGRIRR